MSATEQQAGLFSVGLRIELEHNRRIVHDFGEQRTELWAGEYFATKKGFAVRARGRAQPVRGGRHHEQRPKRIIADDYDTDLRAQNPTLVDQDYRLIKREFLPALAKNGHFAMVGNLFSANCVLQKVKDDPAFLTHQTDLITHGVWDERQSRYLSGVSAWPSEFSLKRISQTRFNVGSSGFLAEFCNQPDDGGSMFLRKWIKRYRTEDVDLSGCIRVLAMDPSAKEGRATDYKASVIVAYQPRSKRFYWSTAGCDGPARSGKYGQPMSCVPATIRRLQSSRTI